MPAVNHSTLTLFIVSLPKSGCDVALMECTPTDTLEKLNVSLPEVPLGAGNDCGVSPETVQVIAAGIATKAAVLSYETTTSNVVSTVLPLEGWVISTDIVDSG